MCVHMQMHALEVAACSDRSKGGAKTAISEANPMVMVMVQYDRSPTSKLKNWRASFKTMLAGWEPLVWMVGPQLENLVSLSQRTAIKGWWDGRPAGASGWSMPRRCPGEWIRTSDNTRLSVAVTHRKSKGNPMEIHFFRRSFVSQFAWSIRWCNQWLNHYS